MKRTAIVLLGLMVAASCLVAQGTPAPAQPAAQQPAAQQPAAPKAKTAPQAKTQDEFKAYQQVVQTMQGGDLNGAEAATDQFMTKFPDSELKPLLYTNLMNAYQQTNNADKTVEYGRKVLTVDADNPVALVMIATVLAERTRDTDLDKDERFGEATKDAKRALEVVDNMALPANAPPAAVENAKNTVRSMAYGALGTVASTQQDFNTAEENLRKAVEIPGIAPDPLTMLRLSVTLDHQKKYAEALQMANKCVEISQEPIKGLASQERDRLVKLTAAPAPAGSTSTTPPAAPKPPQDI